jgi:enolase
MIDYYEQLITKYPIVSIEDGLAEDDEAGWKQMTARLGSRIEIIGDDIFVTSPRRILAGAANKLANSVLIKPNQIGTIYETLMAVRFARNERWGMVISHRSGETADTFIADFAVAVRAGKIKTGAPCRGERVEKYNRLLRIEEELGAAAVYAGREAFVRGSGSGVTEGG